MSILCSIKNPVVCQSGKNHYLHQKIQKNHKRVQFLAHEKSIWCDVKRDGTVIPKSTLFLDDGVHLTAEGYKMLSKSFIKGSQNTSFPLPGPTDRDISGGYDPHEDLAIGLPLPVGDTGIWSSRMNFRR